MQAIRGSSKAESTSSSDSEYYSFPDFLLPYVIFERFCQLKYCNREPFFGSLIAPNVNRGELRPRADSPKDR